MLNINQILKNHSELIKSKIDKEDETSFSWYGKGAEALGLNLNKVNKEDIENILNNTYKDLKLRPSYKINNERDEILAFNSVFSVSDLMSYVCVFLKEIKIEEAFDKSVDETLSYIETLSQERTYKNNIHTKNNTYNLLILKIKNLYSQRNTKEFLHTQCMIMNTTQKEDGSWNRLSFDLIFKNISNIRKIFDLNLERNLKSFGYETIIDEKGNLELVGYDQYKDFIKERKILILNEILKRIEKESYENSLLNSFERNTADLKETNNNYSNTASNYNSSSDNSSLLTFVPSVC